MAITAPALERQLRVTRLGKTANRSMRPRTAANSSRGTTSSAVWTIRRGHRLTASFAFGSYLFACFLGIAFLGIVVALTLLEWIERRSSRRRRPGGNSAAFRFTSSG
jgi:hypothetical protein